MTDFDEFLGKALAPDEREPDRLFVARVQAQVRLEQRLIAERRALLSRLGFELVGLAAVAAGLIVLANSPGIAELAAESPEIIVAGLLAAFGFVVAAFSPAARPAPIS